MPITALIGAAPHSGWEGGTVRGLTARCWLWEMSSEWLTLYPQLWLGFTCQLGSSRRGYYPAIATPKTANQALSFLDLSPLAAPLPRGLACVPSLLQPLPSGLCEAYRVKAAGNDEPTPFNRVGDAGRIGRDRA